MQNDLGFSFVFLTKVSKSVRIESKYLYSQLNTKKPNRILPIHIEP
ncbi:hypothetical protein Aoki45_29990 [Algoriphagus sp. oki45]|nr:hypothetical protein Aoki45_29990 [Algoriphagus sp. oki45]